MAFNLTPVSGIIRRLWFAPATLPLAVMLWAARPLETRRQVATSPSIEDGDLAARIAVLNTDASDASSDSGYIARELTRLGFRAPDGAKSLSATVPAWRVRLNVAGASLRVNDSTFALGYDFFPLAGSPPGFPNSLDLPGTGITFGGRLGARSVTPLSVAGRVVVFLPPVRATDGLPDYQIWGAPGRELAAYHEAAAVLVASLDLTPPHVIDELRAWRPALDENPLFPLPPTSIISRAAASALLGDEDIAFVPTGFHAKSVRLRFGLERRRDASVRNVAGVLAGANAQQASEFIIVMAQLPRVGPGDSLSDHPAAASAAALLEIAEYVAGMQSRTNRSILFLWSNGGGIGVRSFIRNPPIDRDRIVGAIDVSGMGPDTLPARLATGLAPWFAATPDWMNADGAEWLRLNLGLSGRDSLPANWPRCDSGAREFAAAGIPVMSVATSSEAGPASSASAASANQDLTFAAMVKRVADLVVRAANEAVFPPRSRKMPGEDCAWG